MEESVDVCSGPRVMRELAQAGRGEYLSQFGGGAPGGGRQAGGVVR